MRVDLDRGQAMLEFLLASLVGIILILGIIQITLLYNARSMVKLAAFNAARAAIVARHSPRPRSRDPVDLAEMRHRAKRAAFATLLPVIPAAQGRMVCGGQPCKGSQGPPPAEVFDAFETLAQNTSTNDEMSTALNSVFPGRGDVALYELNGQTIDDDRTLVDCLEIRFVNPTMPIGTEAELAAATINSWDDIKFDEPGQESGDNLIKVVVTWRYPLVIPFVNRIITAVARPRLYDVALSASGASATAADMQATGPEPEKMHNMIPIWATGYAFTQVSPGVMGVGGLGGGIASAFSGIQLVNPPPAEGSQVDAGNYKQAGSAPFEGNGEVVFTKPADNDTITQSIGEFLVFRVPIRASFIMRMQWDRSSTDTGEEDENEDDDASSE